MPAAPRSRYLAAALRADLARKMAFVAGPRQVGKTDDLGVLWEHFVLNELHARLQTRDIRYWRDKRGH